MTWALCLNCGEVKYGAICPCPRCKINSSGNFDMDIAFSDHLLARKTLEELGAVMATIQESTADEKLALWAFMVYVSDRWPDMLAMHVEPAFRLRIYSLLCAIKLPPVTMRDSPRKKAYLAMTAEALEQARMN